MAGPKIAAVQNQDLSVLLPYSALILCSSTLAILFVCIALERWLLRRLYGSVWQTLLFGESEERRRSFACLNAGLVINLIVFLIGLYPTFDFLVGRGDLSAPLSTKKDGVTIGDILFILAQLYGANYLFDLCFRAGLARAMGIAHHIGVLIILETSLSLFANLTEYPEATLQFYMCMVWGMPLEFIYRDWTTILMQYRRSHIRRHNWPPYLLCENLVEGQVLRRPRGGPYGIRLLCLGCGWSHR